MSLDRFTELYLSWVNDFISVERFASYYGLTEPQARVIINLGRNISEL